MFNRTIFVATMILVLLINAAFTHAYGDDDITIQGTELIQSVISELQSVNTNADSESIEQRLCSLERANQTWRSFVDHHTTVYMNEITASKEIREKIGAITMELDDIIQKCNKGTVDEIMTGLPSCVQSLEKLVQYCNVPVLLDFTGAVCKSCKVMKLRLQSIANDMVGTARIVIVDVNSQKDLSRKYKIMLIPTLVFIDSSGNEIARHTGEMEEYAVKATLDKLLKK